MLGFRGSKDGIRHSRLVSAEGLGITGIMFEE